MFSGCGKTTNARHVLNYYSHLPSSRSCPGGKAPLTPERLEAVSALLDAFGNCRTVMNANASKFASLFSVDFDSAGALCSASLQTMLLERTRVARRPEGEPNFNVFYQMLAGVDAKTRRELQLDVSSSSSSSEQPNLFMTPLTRAEDKYRASQAWSAVCDAFKTIGATPAESGAVQSALAAIFHLGAASVARGAGANKAPQFARPQAAQRAAQCLGTTLEDLSRAVFQPGQTSSSGALNRKLRPSSAESAPPDGTEALEGFAVGLYQEVFNALVFLINRCLSSPHSNAHHSVLVLDDPGFQNPSSCGRFQGASLEDLCANYLQERLQLMFHERTISSLHERYVQEQVTHFIFVGQSS